MQREAALNSQIVPNRKLLDLPEFCGKPEDWPIFYIAYIESTAAYNYTNFENNQRLNKCLKGEARELIKALLIHPSNCNVVVEQLRCRFGRPEKLIRSQLKIIREIPQISASGISKIVSIATATKNLVAFLQSVNGEQHLATPSLLEELIFKLPINKRIEWAKFSASIQPYPNLKHFSEWVSEVANYINIVQDSVEQKRKNVFHVVERQNYVKPNALYAKVNIKLGNAKSY